MVYFIKVVSTPKTSKNYLFKVQKILLLSLNNMGYKKISNSRESKENCFFIFDKVFSFILVFIVVPYPREKDVTVNTRNFRQFITGWIMLVCVCVYLYVSFSVLLVFIKVLSWTVIEMKIVNRAVYTNRFYIEHRLYFREVILTT